MPPEEKKKEGKWYFSLMMMLSLHNIIYTEFSYVILKVSRSCNSSFGFAC